MDRVIYRDYIVNRRFFIHCNLVCMVSQLDSSIEFSVEGTQPLLLDSR